MSSQTATIPTVSPWVGTSAGEPMIPRARELVISIAGALSVRGTASLDAPDDWAEAVVTSEQTNSGMLAGDPQLTDAGIMELRRRSAFTWEQLARLFDASRRSLHFWASGKPLNALNEERLSRLLAVVRQIDRGSARATRTALLTPLADGAIPFDMLVAEHYDDVVRALGPGQAGRWPEMSPLSSAARDAYLPQEPEVLADARQDTVHRSTGRVRAARAVRVKKEP